MSLPEIQKLAQDYATRAERELSQKSFTVWSQSDVSWLGQRLVYLLRPQVQLQAQQKQSLALWINQAMTQHWDTWAETRDYLQDDAHMIYAKPGQQNPWRLIDYYSHTPPEMRPSLLEALESIIQIEGLRLAVIQKQVDANAVDEEQQQRLTADLEYYGKLISHHRARQCGVLLKLEHWHTLDHCLSLLSPKHKLRPFDQPTRSFDGMSLPDFKDSLSQAKSLAQTWSGPRPLMAIGDMAHLAKTTNVPVKLVLWKINTQEQSSGHLDKAFFDANLPFWNKWNAYLASLDVKKTQQAFNDSLEQANTLLAQLSNKAFSLKAQGISIRDLPSQEVMGAWQYREVKVGAADSFLLMAGHAWKSWSPSRFADGSILAYGGLGVVEAYVFFDNNTPAEFLPDEVDYLSLFNPAMALNQLLDPVILVHEILHGLGALHDDDPPLLSPRLDQPNTSPASIMASEYQPWLKLQDYELSPFNKAALGW